MAVFIRPAAALAVVGLTLAAVLLITGFVVEQGTVIVLGLFVMGGSVVGGLDKSTKA